MQQTWTFADAVAHSVLAKHDGVAHLQDFLAAGLTRQQVAALFRRRVLERPRLGWYADPALCWEAKHAIRVGGVLGCVSAARTYGIPVPPDLHPYLHVTLAKNASRLRHNRDRTWTVAAGEDAEVQLHWSQRTGTPDGWRVPLEDCLLELADCTPFDWFVAALDAALHEPRHGRALLSPESLADVGVRLPRRLRRALVQVDARSESPIESLLRLALRRRGITIVDLQFSPHPRYRVDFLLEGKLIVEADGEAFHDEEQDRLRDALLARLGYRVLRFTYDEIVHDMEAVLTRIEAAIRAR